jgi:hypothetical protein
MLVCLLFISWVDRLVQEGDDCSTGVNDLPIVGVVQRSSLELRFPLTRSSVKFRCGDSLLNRGFMTCIPLQAPTLAWSRIDSETVSTMVKVQRGFRCIDWFQGKWSKSADSTKSLMMMVHLSNWKGGERRQRFMSKLGQAFEILPADDGLRDERNKTADELQHSASGPRAECG